MDKEHIPISFRPKTEKSAPEEAPETPPLSTVSELPEEMPTDLSQTQPQRTETEVAERQGWMRRTMSWASGIKAEAGIWWREFLSGNQERVNTGAVLAVFATILVMVVYGYYAFYLKKDLGDNLTALAQTILAAGFGGFAATEITKIRRGP
jgi:hypothetical protein